MGKSIPIATNPAAPDITIDAALLADAFGLEQDAFRKLMDDRKITVLCERGTGEDAGLYRASFYYGDTRVRLVVDETGQPVTPVERSATGLRRASR